jgi:hypothetical protein
LRLFNVSIPSNESTTTKRRYPVTIWLTLVKSKSNERKVFSSSFTGKGVCHVHNRM